MIRERATVCRIECDNVMFLCYFQIKQVSSLTKWVGGHGSCVGGIIVDKGDFNWGAGKHPIYDEPDTSYSGYVFVFFLEDHLFLR